jgi:TorA maturation chaperone TorD
MKFSCTPHAVNNQMLLLEFLLQWQGKWLEQVQKHVKANDE